MILADNETRVDLLNNEAIAFTIVRLLRAKPDRPVTLGVHGDWGAGKSSILEMIEAEVEEDEKVLCIRFNGWRFQGFEDAKIALIEGIVTGLLEKRPALTKAVGAAKETFKRIDWLKLAKKGGGLAWTAFTGIPTPDQIQCIVETMKGWVGAPAQLATKENIQSAIAGLDGLMKPAEAKHVPEEIAEFRKAFDNLLREAGVEQLVVLVDDLDRCLPDTAIETLEAIRLFVFTERTAFVVAADEAMIEYAVRKHFPELPDTTGPRDYARNYLEKLIQVPFRIPALGEAETRIYVTLLLVGAAVGEGDEGFLKLIAAARERLRRPWVGSVLDFATVKDALGDKAGPLQEVLTLSDQIGPILADGTRGNPRQIKRFLNALVLRQRIAEGRGFGSEVKVPVLAKLMLAELYLPPPFFDQMARIVAAAADGRCQELGALENRVREKSLPTTAKVGGKKTTPADDPEEAPEGQTLLVWMKSDAIRTWALVEPRLADIDLRPYLFVAKDRKDYFGGLTALGKLAEVVERLLGPKFTVQGMSSELKKLAAPEAARVFDGVRSRILSQGDLKTKPDGLDGLITLVGAQPVLESNLVDFLEALPPERIGAWAVSGWDSVIKSSAAKARLEQLLSAWAVSQNPMLKAAAASVQRIPKTIR